MPLRIALVDNYDSYTHNLAHLLATANAGLPPTVVRSDAHANVADLHRAHAPFDAYVLSPGPGTPANPADFPPLQRELLSRAYPTLAVCLGHQALCYFHGAHIAHAPAGPAHGKLSRVVRAPAGHDCPLLSGLPVAFNVVRYHSLCVASGPSPALLATSWATDVDAAGVPHRVLMSVRHRHAPLFGVQFHPESVCTQYGLLLAHNFLRVASVFRRTRSVMPPLPIPHRPPSTSTFRTVIRRVRVALDTNDVFAALYARRPHAFWLDSSSAFAKPLSRCSSPALGADSSDETRDSFDVRNGRFSVLGAPDGPLSEHVTYDVGTRVVTVRQCATGAIQNFRGTIFEYLQRMLRSRYAPPHPDLPIEMNGGYVGFLGYELKRDVDGVRGNVHTSSLPDAWFLFADRFVVADHEQDELFLVALVRDGEIKDQADAEGWFERVAKVLDDAGHSGATNIFDTKRRARVSRPPLRFTPERSRSSYLEDIQQCLREIRDGESYEVCLTNRLRTTLPEGCKIDPFEMYCALRLVNPAPYSAFLRLNDDVVVCCSSPERYLQISSSGRVESKPIKGTLPRGQSFEEDERLRDKLQNSPKDRSENLMIVDLVRNDLSRTCTVDSVRVPRLMHVESYATVHQLVSTVTGKLSQPGEAISCIQSAYPMGSMTGAPKVRTMDIIDRLERSARGIYSGSIGYLSVSGAADLNVVIRTAILQGSEVEIGVGGAIVALSNPEEEYDEVILKGKALMQALAMKTTGRSEFVVVHEREEIEKPSPSKPAG